MRRRYGTVPAVRRPTVVEPDGSTVDFVATHVQPRVGVTERRATRPLRNPVVYFATVDRVDGQVFRS
jgi:hypothetical protein